MIEKCQKIELPTVNDVRGNLSFIESNKNIQFGIQRVYYLYDVPGGQKRGAHAHKELHQLVIALSGSFDIQLDDGFAKKTIQMSRGSEGLYICPMIWRDIDNFSLGAVCLVLASHGYDENDYFRDYEKFIASIRGGKFEPNK
jgi:dTDP-4-dehydrorhamnose 3,5-epimerase-like enzyme